MQHKADYINNKYNLIEAIFFVLLLTGIALTSLYSYLLFHSLSEIFSIIVACAIFMFAWNSRKYIDNNYLIFIGIAYLFIGFVDLVHTLAYKGMNIFSGYGSNLPTQLWIAARYLESISLLIAPVFLGRKLKNKYVFSGYIIAVSLLLASVFYWNNFPVCYIEGIGLTPFKIISEYIISIILLAAIYFLFKKRSVFENDVLYLLVASIGITILAELSFTRYLSVYGFFNLLGHILKVISFYLIYKAIIVTGLTRPYDLLFRNLKRSEDELRTHRDHLKELVDERTGELVALNRELNEEIIERKQAMEKLQKSEEFNKRIVENSYDCIKILDMDGRLLSMSEGGQRLLEIEDIEYYLGNSWIDLWKGDYRQSAILAIEAAKKCDVGRFQGYSPTAKGTPKWWDVVITPLMDANGKVDNLLSISRDITDQKRAEKEIRKLNEELEERVMERTALLTTKSEQLNENQTALMAMVEELNSTNAKLAIARARAEEADRLKSIFLATMSHELRTPLNSIIGFSSTLLEGWSGELNPEQKEQLELVHSSGKHLLSLINDVIDISKIEAGKIDIYIEDFSLKGVVDEATSIVKVDTDHKGLAMTVDVPDITMATDRRRLLQCLLNLVSNAVKFTDKGGIAITAKTINNSICISVTDTGIGITSDDLKKLFAPFVRLESPLTQKTSGTGLGLYLTQKLATEVLGGSVEAVSEYGVGSTFTLCAALRQEEV